jgi:hypothetical protein
VLTCFLGFLRCLHGLAIGIAGTPEGTLSHRGSMLEDYVQHQMAHEAMYLEQIRLSLG